MQALPAGEVQVQQPPSLLARPARAMKANKLAVEATKILTPAEDLVVCELSLSTADVDTLASEESQCPASSAGSEQLQHLPFLSREKTLLLLTTSLACPCLPLLIALPSRDQPTDTATSQLSMTCQHCLASSMTKAAPLAYSLLRRSRCIQHHCQLLHTQVQLLQQVQLPQHAPLGHLLRPLSAWLDMTRFKLCHSHQLFLWHAIQSLRLRHLCCMKQTPQWLLQQRADSLSISIHVCAR
ncbi:hypothetical protein ABBQ38_002680 [Trebouxia sp. C0009 RCD-2024]